MIAFAENTLYAYEQAACQNGYAAICGVDEAGRGPLAGDVYAAAVILPPGLRIEGVNDSKKLTEKKREALYDVICEKSAAWCVATATVEEIDRLNILQATFLAMRRAVAGLKTQPDLILVDGNRDPKIPGASSMGTLTELPDAPLPGIPLYTMVGGDARSASIAAASILAKVARDRYMRELAENYPAYQFEKHKGYGTKLHYELLEKHGISAVHRKTFLKNLH